MSVNMVLKLFEFITHDTTGYHWYLAVNNFRHVHQILAWIIAARVVVDDYVGGTPSRASDAHAHGG
jgi:hypothetical protein